MPPGLQGKTCSWKARHRFPGCMSCAQISPAILRHPTPSVPPSVLAFFPDLLLQLLMMCHEDLRSIGDLRLLHREEVALNGRVVAGSLREDPILSLFRNVALDGMASWFSWPAVKSAISGATCRTGPNRDKRWARLRRRETTADTARIQGHVVHAADAVVEASNTRFSSCPRHACDHVRLTLPSRSNSRTGRTSLAPLVRW